MPTGWRLWLGEHNQVNKGIRLHGDGEAPWTEICEFQVRRGMRPPKCPHQSWPPGGWKVRGQTAVGSWSAHVSPGAWLRRAPCPLTQGHTASRAQPFPSGLSPRAEAHSLPAVTIGGQGATLRPGPREVRGG